MPVLIMWMYAQALPQMRRSVTQSAQNLSSVLARARQEGLFNQPSQDSVTDIPVTARTRSQAAVSQSTSSLPQLALQRAALGSSAAGRSENDDPALTTQGGDKGMRTPRQLPPVEEEATHECVDSMPLSSMTQPGSRKYTVLANSCCTCLRVYVPVSTRMLLCLAVFPSGPAEYVMTSHHQDMPCMLLCAHAALVQNLDLELSPFQPRPVLQSDTNTHEVEDASGPAWHSNFAFKENEASPSPALAAEVPAAASQQVRSSACQHDQNTQQCLCLHAPASAGHDPD
jgi:hypothetical protein